MTTPAAIHLPLRAIVDGRTWRMFGVDYTTADGEFSTYIYALSAGHAAAIVDELRQTARLGGLIEGTIPCDTN